jgi:predicted MPP superfamily phosphohydrolase
MSVRRVVWSPGRAGFDHHAILPIWPEGRVVSVFLLLFFLIYGSLHAYAFFKARVAFGFGRGVSLTAIPVLGVLCGGPLIVHLLGTHELARAARVGSWIAFTWMGLLFFLTWLHATLDAVNLIARLVRVAFGRGARPLVVPSRMVFLAVVGVSVVLGIIASLEASRVRVEHVRLASPKLPASVQRLRIAQISDVHLGLMVRHRAAAAITTLIRDARPDLLVCTGDLVDAGSNHLDGLSEMFRSIPAPLGKYAVTGNHEFYAGIGSALEFTRRAGFTVLRGEMVVVGEVLRIAGVDDPTGEALDADRRPSETEILGGAASPLFTLLLKHRPVLSAAARSRVDLQLSGHTHRGQLFPFRLLVRFSYPFLAGLYTVEAGGALYVSRGTGTWGPRMRFLSPPEITVIDIERATAHP